MIRTLEGLVIFGGLSEGPPHAEGYYREHEERDSEKWDYYESIKQRPRPNVVRHDQVTHRWQGQSHAHDPKHEDKWLFDRNLGKGAHKASVHQGGKQDAG